MNWMVRELKQQLPFSGIENVPHNLLAYSNHGECVRLLTENEAGSIPATPAKGM